MEIAAVLADKGAEVVCVGPVSTVEDVVRAMETRHIGAVLVVAGESVLGVVSERDVVAALARGLRGLLARPVQEIMHAPVLSVTPDETLVGALRLMTDRRVRHLPVLDSGHLVGLVSIGDLVKARIGQIEREATELKDYIAMA